MMYELFIYGLVFFTGFLDFSPFGAIKIHARVTANQEYEGRLFQFERLLQHTPQLSLFAFYQF